MEDDCDDKNRGNLKEYLYLEGNRLMEIERMKTEAAIETIGLIAEAYVTALVVGPYLSLS